MKLPRDLSGEDLAAILMKYWAYSKVHQAGSHYFGQIRLSRDEKHHPAEYDGRAYEEDEAIGAVSDHLPGSFALGNAEHNRGAEREQHHRCKVRGPEHQADFLPVRRLWASTAAMTFSKPATTMNRVP